MKNLLKLAFIILVAKSGFAQNPEKAFIQAKNGNYVPRPQLFRDEIYAAQVIIDGVTQTGTQTGILNDSDGSIDDADGQHSHLSIISSGTSTAIIAARWKIEPGTNEAYCPLWRTDWRLAGAWLTINGREFDLNDGSIDRPDTDTGYEPTIGDRLGTHGGIRLVMDADFLEADSDTRAELGQPDFVVATFIYGLESPTLEDAGLMYWPGLLTAVTDTVVIRQPMHTWAAQTLGVGPY